MEKLRCATSRLLASPALRTALAPMAVMRTPSVWVAAQKQKGEPPSAAVLEAAEVSAARDAREQRRQSSGLFVGGRFVTPKALNYALPHGLAPEIAFAGRSNVGKSSLVGALLGSAVARRSKKPGCTQTVNFYAVAKAGTLTDPNLYLVDLPGYGYAKRGKGTQETWSRATLDYLSARNRVILRHAVVVVDARRGLGLGRSGASKDVDAVDAFSALQLTQLVILAKVDLATPAEIAESIFSTFQYLHEHRRMSTALPIVHLVSAKTGFGIDELKDHLANVAMQC